MSRCFPFPPPGYEKKLKTENLDIFAKEKRKEKKHKKEKKDKEKREHREKKEKDRSKDKHKEKKDKKEKRRDRKRDKVKASEDRPEICNELQIQETVQKAEESKDSKLIEELGRRTRDDGAANRMAGIVPPSLHRTNDRVGFARTLHENDKFVDKKLFPAHFSAVQRSDGSSLSIENAACSQKKIGNLNAATSADHERSKLGANIVSTTDQNRNHGISRPNEIFLGSVNRKPEYPTPAAEKERIPQKQVISGLERGKLGSKPMVASSSASAQRKTDFFDFSPENIASIRCKTPATANTFVQSRMEGISMSTMEKERNSKGGAVLSHPVALPAISDPRRNPSFCQPLDMDNRYQKVDKLDANSKKAVEKMADIGKKDHLLNTLNSKPLAPHKNNTKIADEFTKKRPDLKINGFLQESEERPNKMPKLTPFPQLPASDNTTIIRPHAATNNSKPDRIKLDNKRKRNAAVENGEALSKPPHPDSKYLDRIYKVPQMDSWPETDDSGWLFNHDSKQKDRPRAEGEVLPPAQVWAKAMWIDSVDALALPYVVPF